MQRAPEIAQLSATQRKRAIAQLEKDQVGLFSDYLHDLRAYQSGNEFARTSGRFDLSARGKVNTYALFAELSSTLVSFGGRAGIIVPTGIATDSTNASFFGDLVSRRRIVSLHDFQTGLGFFDRIGHARYKFCLLTFGWKTGSEDTIAFSFFSRTAEEFADRRRHFDLTPQQISAVSPNSGTAPIFRTQLDADISARIYGRIPVLLNDRVGVKNLWNIEFRQGLFNKTADGAKLVLPENVPDTDHILHIGQAPESNSDWLQVLEGHQGYIYDHRFASFQRSAWHEVSTHQKQSFAFEIGSEVVMKTSDFLDRIRQKGFRQRGYWIALRRVASSTNERTIICAALPDLPATYGWLIAKQPEGSASALLLANLNSMVCDFCMRVKLNQPSIPLDTLYQIPILSPQSYSDRDISSIVPRVLELTYTSYSMTPFARDIGYTGEPFKWDEDLHLDGELPFSPSTSQWLAM